MDLNEYSEFKIKLEEIHKFPCEYLFKFIAPTTKKNEVISLLPKNGNMSFRSSHNDKFVSISLKVKMNKSENIIEIYKEIRKISGVIIL